jgi:hypothetical protein
LGTGADPTEQTWWTDANIGRSARAIGGFPRVATRFGADVGLDPSVAFSDFNVNTTPKPPELIEASSSNMPRSYFPYYRHPNRFNGRLDIRGGVPIGFADAHVASYQVGSLFTPPASGGTTSVSTYQVLWSQLDRTMESSP